MMCQNRFEKRIIWHAMPILFSLSSSKESFGIELTHNFFLCELISELYMFISPPRIICAFLLKKSTLSK